MKKCLSLLSALIVSLFSLNGYASGLGPVVTKSDAASVGIICDETNASSNICEAYKWDAERYCETNGTRLPTILELATVLAPEKIIPASGQGSYLPPRQGLCAVDAFNYEDWEINLKPATSSRLDQFYFKGYNGPIDSYSNALDGIEYWSKSSGQFIDNNAWSLFLGKKVKTGEKVAIITSWVVRRGGVKIPFRCATN